jgi:drug/metabolite transporter (DMT)-like permease
MARPDAEGFRKVSCGRLIEKAVVATAQGHSLPRERPVWADFFVQGLLQSALPFTLISWGEMHIASGLAGVTMTMGIDALGGVGTATPLAQVAVLGASLCYALAPIWGQRFSALPAIVTAAGAMSCAASLMLPTAAILERPWTLAPTAQAIAAVISLAVVCTALAMVIYFRLIRTLGPLGTTSGSYLRAGFAVVLGTAWLGESFGWSMLAGMALIVAGVVAVTAPLPPRQDEKPPV